MKTQSLFDPKKAAKESGKKGQAIRKDKEADGAYAVKKLKPGQRKLNQETDSQTSALAALSEMGIKDAIMPAISVAVETANEVNAAIESGSTWLVAIEEGRKANEFWTAETAKVRDENRQTFLNLNDTFRAGAIHLMTVATGGDTPADSLVCFIGWADHKVQAEIKRLKQKFGIKKPHDPGT